MAALQILLAIILVGWGILFFKHGRSEPTADEDTGRDDSFLYEFLYGPAGYERVRGLVGGSVLITMGICLVAFTLFGI